MHTHSGGYETVTVTVWAEAIERGGKLAPGDIGEALTCFKDKTEKEASLIILNPKMVGQRK